MPNSRFNSDQKMEALFQNASLGILVIDKSGEIVLVNNFLLMIFGYQEVDDLIGKKVEVLIPSRFQHQHVKDRNGYSVNPERRPMGVGLDLFGVKRNGEEFPVEISLSSYSNTEGSFVIGFVSDITRRKEIEQSVLDQQKELAERNKLIVKLNQELENKVEMRTQQLQSAMQELEKSKDELTRALSKEKELGDLKSRFVSMASHEFRTPLSTILSSASLLAKYSLTDEQDKRDKHIFRIKSAVNNLTDILNDFLSIGKIEDGKITAKNSLFDIRELVVNLSGEMNGILKAGQKLICTHSGSTDIYLDASLLKNILINLISNAIKFSGQNSQIVISSSVFDEVIELKVRDAGIGMSQEDQTHLFERFFRATNASNIQGTGLGLHIVGKYIELMDGDIKIKSELEKGTEIILTFHT